MNEIKPEHLRNIIDGITAGAADSRSDRDSAALGRLLAQQTVCSRLQHYLLEQLACWSDLGAWVSHIDGRHLHICCADNAVASRVRFIQNELISHCHHYSERPEAAGMQDLLQGITTVRVRIRRGDGDVVTGPAKPVS